MDRFASAEPCGLLGRLWLGLRRLTGDDAYDRYLAHWRKCHGDAGPPLSRAAFYAAELQRRWNGIGRCC
ncbi:YbdD/YjiX family protein [Candidatus Methylocalor cossyra]